MKTTQGTGSLFIIKMHRADEMSQWIKVFDSLSLIPRPQGRKREPTSKSCPLTATCAAWYRCFFTYIYITYIHNNNNNYSNYFI